MIHVPKAPLEPAEFYFWHDGRPEWDQLCEQKQFDPNPAASEARTAAVEARFRARDPDWSPDTSCTQYFDVEDADIGPDLVPPVSAFRARRPKSVAHHEWLTSYSYQLASHFWAVSPAWKSAIESLEPGLHQFFPHTLRFADGALTGGFIMRQRQQVEMPERYFQTEMLQDAFDRITGYRMMVDGKPGRITLERGLIAGRHFLRRPRDNWYFVSRALAEKLHPLLPNHTSFMPVDVSGAPPFVLRVPTIPPHPLLKSFDAALADALTSLAKPGWSLSDKALRKAHKQIETRVNAETIDRIFQIMEVTLEFEGPLQQNFAFQCCWDACENHPEADVLDIARLWARDPDPRKRVAVARALSGHVRDSETPTPETFAIITGLFDDPDPRVIQHAMTIIIWTQQPAYVDALRARRATLENHPDAELRKTYYDLITAEYDPKLSDDAKALQDRIAAADIPALFDLCLEEPREDQPEAVDLGLQALRQRREPDVAALAFAWAQHADPARRLIAAKALDRPPLWGTPSADAIEAIRILAADAEKQVVQAALSAFATLTANGAYQPHQLGPVQHLETHADPDIREAYARIFVNNHSPASLAVLLRMARDPADTVRITVAHTLQCAVVVTGLHGSDLRQVREALADLLKDRAGYVRLSAIDGLTFLGDARASQAILEELERDDLEAPTRLGFLAGAIVARPDRRYLPALKRWQSRYQDGIDLEEAIQACTIRRWFA